MSPPPGGERPSGFFPSFPNPRLVSETPWPLRKREKKQKTLQLLAVDHSARASMKNAASCEN